jgi:hypothetical protein
VNQRLSDEQLFSEFEELRKEFGSGEGEWVDGTPEGNILWEVSHFDASSLLGAGFAFATREDYDLAEQWARRAFAAGVSRGYAMER